MKLLNSLMLLGGRPYLIALILSLSGEIPSIYTKELQFISYKNTFIFV